MGVEEKRGALAVPRKPAVSPAPQAAAIEGVGTAGVGEVSAEREAAVEKSLLARIQEKIQRGEDFQEKFDNNGTAGVFSEVMEGLSGGKGEVKVDTFITEDRIAVGGTINLRKPIGLPGVKIEGKINVSFNLDRVKNKGDLKGTDLKIEMEKDKKGILGANEKALRAFVGGKIKDFNRLVELDYLGGKGIKDVGVRLAIDKDKLVMTVSKK